MAYAPLALRLRDLPVTYAPSNGKGLFARFMAALVAARQHDAEREIARYVADAGGKFTDETEREIERRFLSSPSHW
jgi:hypothetical protein